MIQNLENGKVYIGSTVNASRRIAEHEYSFQQRTCNNKFYDDVEKGDKFTCQILEKYNNIARYELRDREELFVRKYDSFNTGYNNEPVITYDPYFYQFNPKAVDWLMELL